MVKKKIVYYGFIVLCALGFIYFSFFLASNLNKSSDVLTNDGFIFSLDSKKNTVNKSNFKKGNKIYYKRFGSAISIDTSNKVKNYSLSNVLQYNDGSIGVLSKTVGADITTINNDIIFYYNFFKDYKISKNNGEYAFNYTDDEKVSFKSILMRLDKNKYYLTGNNIRLMYSEDKIIDMGDYVYIEYTDGDVVNVYNDKEVYNIVSNTTKLVLNNVYINLSTKEIFYEGNKKISLTNLVLDNDENINLLTIDDDATINTSTIGGEANGGNGDGGIIDNNGNSTEVTTNPGEINNDPNNPNNPNDPNNNQDTDIEEEETVNVTYKVPKFNVTELNLSALKIDTAVTIEDDDEVLTSDVSFKIVQNSNNKVVYEEVISQGEISAEISYANLKPDTEYTLVANADFKIESEEYNRNFLSKIFRTEDLGVSIDKSYATSNSLVVELTKENYSKVNSCMVSVNSKNGDEITARGVSFSESNIVSIPFNDLDSNTSYDIKVFDIQSEGITVDNGFNIVKSFKTLKEAPNIGELIYRIDKKDSKFDLSVDSVVDKDSGIKSYRWEVIEANGDYKLVSQTFILNRL